MNIFISLVLLLATPCHAKSSSSSEEDLEKMSVLFGTMNGIMGSAMDRIEEIDSKKDIQELNPFDFLRNTLMKILPPSVTSKVKEITPKVTIQSSRRTFPSFADILEFGDSASDENLGQLHGPHICTKEYNNKLMKEEAKPGCEKMEGAVRCISHKQTDEGVLQTVRIQECCSGFGATNIVKYGCNMETKEETLNAFLEARNGSKFPENVPSTFTALVSEENPNEITLFKGKIRNYDLFNDNIITSVDNGKFIVHQKKSSQTASYLNCVALKETNRVVTDGIVMTSSEPIRPAAETVLELLEKDGRFKNFLSTLSESAKGKLSSKNTSVTVMPFTDEAFNSFPKGLQEQITSKQKCATTVIEKSHMFQPATCSNDLKSADSHATFFFSERAIRIGDAQIVESDLVALNGIVHVVDDVIIKDEIMPWEEKVKVADPEMAELFGGLVEDNQPITILLPVKHNVSNMSKEEAMNQVIPWFLPKLNALPPTITTMGNSTIFAGKFDQRQATGTTIEFTFPRSAAKNKRKPAEPTFQIGCSRFTVHPVTKSSKLSACGSSVFFIDKPLPIVTFTMTEFLQSREDLSRFASLFNIYAFNNTLPRVSTLFAPVDDAFAVNHFRKLKHDDQATIRFVKSVLVSKPLCDHNLNPCSKEIRKEVIVNKNGDILHIANEDDDIYIEGSRILETVVVSNGVVHLMENIIIRKESSSIQRHHNLSSADFDDFVSALE